jgi:uncharacterized SAM-binding protein YcdF (DUF218 family)
MVLLLTDVFLLLTQVLLWLLIGIIAWFVLLKALPRAFLSLLVLLLIVTVLVLAFFQGPPTGSGTVLEILWRIISFPFTPLGLALIFLSLLLSGGKLSKLARRIVTAGLVIIALGMFPIVANFLAQELELEAIELVRPLPPLPAGAQRVIVLLGQDSTRAFLRPPRDSAPPPATETNRQLRLDTLQIVTQQPIQLSERGDRLTYAAQLYQQEVINGNRPVILVSATTRADRQQKSGERKEDISEARDVQLFLSQTLGIPDARILLDHDSGSVRRSAEATQRLLRAQNINFGNQLMLVGTAMNLNRAVWTFGNVFPDATIGARPTDFRALPPSGNIQRLRGRDLIERQVQATDFLPSPEAFALSSEALEEYLNSLYYFLRGWIRPFQISPTTALLPFYNQNVAQHSATHSYDQVR